MSWNYPALTFDDKNFAVKQLQNLLWPCPYQSQRKQAERRTADKQEFSLIVSLADYRVESYFKI